MEHREPFSELGSGSLRTNEEDNEEALNTCVTCKETSEQVALHYTKLLCNGCRAFFKRTVQGKVKILECKSDGHCVVDPFTRKLCKACRLEACKRAGVDSTKVQQPREDGHSPSLDDKQFYPDMHIDGSMLHIPPSSMVPQTPFPPYSVSALGPQFPLNMYSIPPAVHTPSIDFGVFNSNLNPSFINGHMANPHPPVDNQLQLHLRNSQAGMLDQSMQMWRQSVIGSSMLPATYAATDANSGLISAFQYPYRNSLDTQRSQDALWYMDMARNMSMMGIGQGFMYHSNSAPANQDMSMAYPSLYSQSTLANYDSFSRAQNFTNSWIDGQGHTPFHDRRVIPASLSASPPTSLTVSHTLSGQTTEMLKPEDEPTSLMTLPHSSDAAILSERRSTISDEHGRAANQLSEGNVKEEFGDYDSTNGTDNLRDKSDALTSSAGYNISALNDSVHAPELDKNTRCPAETGQDLSTVSMNKHVSSSCLQRSGKSRAFMIDMLLKPRQTSPKKEVDNEPKIFTSSAHGSDLGSPLLGLTRHQTHIDKTHQDMFSPTVDRLSKVQPLGQTCPRDGCADDEPASETRTLATGVCHHLEAGSGLGRTNETSCPELHSRSSSPDEMYMQQVRHSTPKHGDGVQFLNGTLDDFHVSVNNTDEETSVDKAPQRSTESKPEHHQGKGDSGKGCLVDYKLENEKKMKKNECDDGIEVTAKNINKCSTLPTMGLDRTQGGSDSGLGNSGDIFNCERSKTKFERAPQICITTNISNDTDVHEHNDENVLVAQIKHRKRMSKTATGKTNIKKRKHANLDQLPATLTSQNIDKKNHLTEIPDNGQKTLGEQEKHHLPVHFVINNDPSTEKDTTARSPPLHTRVANTKVANDGVDKSQMFLHLVSAFAEYCKCEEAHTEQTSISNIVQTRLDARLESPESFSCQISNQSRGSQSSTKKLESFDRFQQELMTKVRCLDTYTMTEFKADVNRLTSLAREAGALGKHHLHACMASETNTSPT